MGKRKADTTHMIEDQRSRNIRCAKRGYGIVKKCMDLVTMCGAQVQIRIITSQHKALAYQSEGFAGEWPSVSGHESVLRENDYEMVTHSIGGAYHKAKRPSSGKKQKTVPLKGKPCAASCDSGSGSPDKTRPMSSSALEKFVVSVIEN